MFLYAGCGQTQVLGGSAHRASFIGLGGVLKTDTTASPVSGTQEEEAEAEAEGGGELVLSHRARR